MILFIFKNRFWRQAQGRGWKCSFPEGTEGLESQTHHQAAMGSRINSSPSDKFPEIIR